MKKYNLFGLVIIIAGVVLLCIALGVVKMPLGVSFWEILWPGAIILCGAYSMVTVRRVTVWGSIITALGLYFLLINLRVMTPINASVFWPILLIVIGIAIFLPTKTHMPRGTVDAQNEDGFIKSLAIFGEDDRAIAGECFTGAQITTIFAGTKLDITGFETCADKCIVNMTVAFGGVELHVPKNVRVVKGGLVCVFGGCDFKGMPDVDAPCTIELAGVCAFGGVEVITR